MNKYSLLTCHTEYSLMKSTIRCNKLGKRLEEAGVDACAITDYGSISGAVDFETALKNNKKILGCKFNVPLEGKETASLTILAKNHKGWQTLLRWVSYSNSKDNFTTKPILPFELMTESDDNLICLSGSEDSWLEAQIVEDGKLPDNAKVEGCRKAQELVEIFGKDNVFIELDALTNPLTKIMREIAQYCDLKAVAVPQPHYLRSDDYNDHHVLLASSINKPIDQVSKREEFKKFFNDGRYHIPSYDELLEHHSEEEIENTNFVAGLCEEYEITNHPTPPVFECPDGMTDKEYLRQLCVDGWKELIEPIIKDKPELKTLYGERVKMELGIFEEYNLCSYFLIVQDIIKYCHSKHYLTGTGRGSAAGCLVSYLIGITQIDPILHNLLFERFLNPGRLSKDHISLPDIDIDVPQQARQEVIDDLRDKYGKDNVAQILTFTTMKGKKALKQVMMAQGGISFDVQNAITKNIVDEAAISDELQIMKEERGFKSGILWAIEHKSKAFEEWVKVDGEGNISGDLAHIFEQAMRLEYTKIIQSRHAAGVVVSPHPIHEHCPMVNGGKKVTELIAGFEGPSCEDVGLLKLDVLGIRMLDKVMSIATIALKEEFPENGV